MRIDVLARVSLTALGLGGGSDELIPSIAESREGRLLNTTTFDIFFGKVCLVVENHDFLIV